MTSHDEFLFTSESVTEGHPDKIADQISDSVLDAVMADDPAGRVACETLVNTGRQQLKLHRPIYRKTAAYGHFGREDEDFTWQRTDKAAALREAAGLGEAAEVAA